METKKGWFECARCGRESEVTAPPPKCSYCGSSNGTVSAKPRRETKDEPGKGPADKPPKKGPAGE
jgi:DNA-directed RNA polymerase subunit RPC12/RpoP